MADIDLNWGGTLSLSPTGDIAVSDGTVYGQQRVLRRLLTNPGDYLWELDYGAGLSQIVGDVANAAEITSIIQEQMLLEAVVDQDVPPSVAVSSANDGTVQADVNYADADTGEQSVLSLPL